MRIYDYSNVSYITLPHGTLTNMGWVHKQDLESRIGIIEGHPALVIFATENTTTVNIQEDKFQAVGRGTYKDREDKER
jgi:hypothetical protein